MVNNICYYTTKRRNEDCEKALDLINEILEKEGYSRISKTGAPTEEVVEEDEKEEVEEVAAALDDGKKLSKVSLCFIAEFSYCSSFNTSFTALGHRSSRALTPLLLLP